MVWECDPAGVLTAEPRPALGLFNHEAAAVDPAGKRLYLTEDESDGGFYRFTPAAYPSLGSGLLEVAVVDAAGRVTWRRVPDPDGRRAHRHAPAGAGDDEVQRRRGHLVPPRLPLLHHQGRQAGVGPTSPPAAVSRSSTTARRRRDSALDAVDNVTVSTAGEIFVCEDGGNMEIGLITPQRVGLAVPALRGARPRVQRGVRRGVRPVGHAALPHLPASVPRRPGAGTAAVSVRGRVRGPRPLPARANDLSRQLPGRRTAAERPAEHRRRRSRVRGWR